MFCSSRLQPPVTLIPTPLRDRLGTVLQGPPRGKRGPSQRACLFTLGRIGDFVLTLSAIRLLLRQFGPEGCTLVVARAQAPLAQREFPGVQCVSLPTEADGLIRDILPIWWKERRKFANLHFDRLICLRHQRALYHELVLSWIAASQDIRLMPETYPEAPAPGLCAELLGHWRLTETALGRPVARENILPRFTSLHAGNDGRLLICPCSLDVTRSLPADVLVGTLQTWRGRHRAPIVLGGSPADNAALQQLASVLRTARITDVRVETPAGLDGLLDQVARAGAIFAADSAPAHVAAALDKPSVVLTSPTYFGHAQPWARSARQQSFVHGTPAEQVAAALPPLP